MTVAEATTIADNALEHSVRTVLASLEAPLFLAWRSGASCCLLLAYGRQTTASEVYQAQRCTTGSERQITQVRAASMLSADLTAHSAHVAVRAPLRNKHLQVAW